MSARYCSALLLCCGVGVSWLAAEDVAIPEALPKERYDAMIARSPFSLATEEAAPTAPGFATNLFVSGIAKLGDRDMVTVASRANNAETFTLIGTEDSHEGISLVSIQWSEKVGKSTVTIKKGADIGVIAFNEALLSAPMAMVPTGPSGPTIPVPRTGPSLPTIPTIPSAAVPGGPGAPAPTRVRRVIRRPGDR